MKKLMKTGNKQQFKTNKIYQQFLSTYKKYFESEESKTDHSYTQTANNVMFNHMSEKRVIKLFKERAIAAMYKEFNQLEKLDMPYKPVVLPQYPMKFTRTEKREALEAVKLIKEKRTGTIKGNTCENGSKQRSFLKDGEEFASPKISLETLFISLVIDAHEGRDITNFDIPGAINGNNLFSITMK